MRTTWIFVDSITNLSVLVKSMRSWSFLLTSADFQGQYTKCAKEFRMLTNLLIEQPTRYHFANLILVIWQSAWSTLLCRNGTIVRERAKESSIEFTWRDLICRKDTHSSKFKRGQHDIGKYATLEYDTARNCNEVTPVSRPPNRFRVSFERVADLLQIYCFRAVVIGPLLL